MGNICTAAAGTRALMVGDGQIDLPEGVVFEILLRLPVTSIFRFKCVCRNWYDEIESQEFREKHYALQKNSTLVVEENYPRVAKICAGKNMRVVGNLNMPTWSDFVTGPCRGLFLFQFNKSLSSLSLSNPSTRTFRLLPRMPYAHISDSSHYAFGLGWDPVTDDYKVVYYPYHRQAAAVYSLNNHSWRLLVDSPLPKLSADCEFNHHPRWKIYTNGFCYWLSSDGTHPSLISFDVTQEKFEMVILPSNVTISEVTVMYNSLALLAWEGDYQVIEVWILRQEQQHYWTKVFSFPQMDPSICVAGIWNHTHVLLRKYTSKGLLKELFMYDMKNDHYEEKITADYISLSFLNYKESLFSVNSRPRSNKDWTAS